MHAFVEKPPRDEAPTNEINAGTYVLEASVLERIPEGGRVSIERETFPAMVRDGGLFARSDDRYWLDTGTPSAYLEANFDYVEQKRGPLVAPGLVDRGDASVVEGESAVEGESSVHRRVLGCVVEPGAPVERTSWAAARSCRAGAVVLDSVLMEGCRVARTPRCPDRSWGRVHRRTARRRGAGLGARCRCRRVVGDPGRRRTGLG